MSLVLLVVLLLVASLYVDVICILYASYFDGLWELLGYDVSLVCLCIVALGFGIS